jgi:hypothetical protein
MLHLLYVSNCILTVSCVLFFSLADDRFPYRFILFSMSLQELEPLPDLDCLKDIREFHTSLFASYASRDQFLKVSLVIIFLFLFLMFIMS